MKRMYRDISSKKKVKNKTMKKQIDLNAIQVPLANKFDILSDMEDENMTTNVQKISPIIVTDLNVNIQSLLINCQINCDIKLMSIGRKIFPQTSNDKTKLLEALKATKVNFFSHPDASNKVFKAVLSGLPEMPTNDIVSCLQTNYELTPSKIVMFNTKSHNKLYLCHFDKANTNMKLLKSIKVVHQHIVTWMPYKPKRMGPTQCYRCCMYGHGISSCNRFAVCMLCSGNHTTTECNVITPSTTNPTFKCFNCECANIKHDHKANDPNCPFRAKYELSRDNARNKHKQKPSSNRRNTFNANDKVSSVHRFVLAPAPLPQYASYASVTQAQNNIQPNIDNRSKQQHTHTSNSNSNNDLWSISEVTSLLLSSINELNKCTSKLDQLKVIANLLQHACK